MTPERWQQITGMFHEALLRDSGRRRTFLEDACGADEALRAEVEGMLAAHDNAGDPGSIPVVAVSERMLRLESGSAVGRYRIDALIKLHTVAFWKTFLEGDHRYMRYLTPGYARSHQLQAVVFKID